MKLSELGDMPPEEAQQKFLEFLTGLATQLSDPTKRMAIKILEAALPKDNTPSALDYGDIQCLHSAFRYMLVQDFHVPIPDSLRVIEKTLRPKGVLKKYIKVLQEGTFILNGILDEAQELGVALGPNEEATKIYLARLLARYALWYVIGHKPPNVPLGLPVITNILCPTFDEGSDDQWDESVKAQLPSYFYGNKTVRKMILTRWLNPSTAHTIGVREGDVRQ